MEIDKLTKKKLIDTNFILTNKLKIKFSIRTLDNIIAFIYKDSALRTRKRLTNIYNLMGYIDKSMYTGNPDLEDRIWIIQKSIQCMLSEGIETTDFVLDYCKDSTDCSENAKNIIDDIPYMPEIPYKESKYLIKKLEDMIKYGYTIEIKKIFKEYFDQIDESDISSYKSLAEDMETLAMAVINVKRHIGAADSEQTFSLEDEMFENVIEDAVKKLKDRNRIFITGVRYLNVLLSPGFMSKRLYTFLAFPGKGKSMILLKSALDIRKYNKNVKTKDPDKRPAVLMLTLENDIPETVERIYNMTVDSDDIRNYTPNQVIKKMKRDGHLKLTKDNNIDIIIKEYKNRSIDTNDIYGIINDLADQGVEVIALIVDYMKRIRPAEKAPDEKGELKNISNELKELAKHFDIPVITAQQLNRSGAAVIDAALQANKEDVTRLVGSANIGTSWEIQENSDMCIIINPEVKADTGDLYMTFKRIKRRYRSIEETEELRRLEYFNQPFEKGSEIRLVDDIYMDKPAALTSLATQFKAIEDKRGKANVVEREKKKTSNSIQTFDDFDPFKFDN
jgi:hypothetical protein